MRTERDTQRDEFTNKLRQSIIDSYSLFPRLEQVDITASLVRLLNSEVELLMVHNLIIPKEKIRCRRADRRNKLYLDSYCKECKSKVGKKWRKDNNWDIQRKEMRSYPRIINQEKARDKKRNVSLKEEFIKEYGGTCACCGENNIRFLSIDHINGKGKEHRMQLRGTGRGGNTRTVLSFLKKNNWPKDEYQILCYNCNIAKSQNNNICPHEQERKRILYAV